MYHAPTMANHSLEPIKGGLICVSSVTMGSGVLRVALVNIDVGMSSCNIVGSKPITGWCPSYNSIFAYY